MSFTFHSKHLAKLCEQNAFEIPKNRMVFFGLRGCLPVNPNNHAVAESQELRVAEVDSTRPRCTIGQWRPGDDELAVFPGSTTPHSSFTGQGPQKANQLFTGLHDYYMGYHMPGSHARWHKAFHKKSEDPVLRTFDDGDYDNLDKIDYVSPRDNIHSAWCDSIDSTWHAGGGCQVVVGYPQCAKRNNDPDAGPWKVFRQRGYEADQEIYLYVLLNGYDAERVTQLDGQALPMRLRYGSSGDVVKEMQARLKGAGFFPAEPTGTYGITTLRSVVTFQRTKFSPSSGDGIVGPMTAEALGMGDWPEV